MYRFPALKAGLPFPRENRNFGLKLKIKRKIFLSFHPPGWASPADMTSIPAFTPMGGGQVSVSQMWMEPSADPESLERSSPKIKESKINCTQHLYWLIDSLIDFG